KPGVQRLARYELHRDVELTGLLADFENLADEGMVERGGGHRLPAETCVRRRIGGEPWTQDLNRDVAVQARVAGLVHFAPATRADRCKKLIRTEFFASVKKGRLCRTGQSTRS